MENASKALIIAGAILIAILLISVGIMVFNSTGGVTESLKSSMSEQEKKSFNDKFLNYEGKNVRGTSVKSLLQTVSINNRDEDMPKVKVTASKGSLTDSELENGPDTSWINTSLTYKVTVTYNDSLVDRITIE